MDSNDDVERRCIATTASAGDAAALDRAGDDGPAVDTDELFGVGGSRAIQRVKLSEHLPLLSQLE